MLAPGVGFIDDQRAGRFDGEEDEGVALRSVSGPFFSFFLSHLVFGHEGILNACWTYRIVVDSQ